VAACLGASAAKLSVLLVEREPFTPDLATAVELGQRFESFLAEAGLAGATLRDVIADFRGAYAVPLPADPASGAAHDPALARFLRVCAGRAIHGANLHRAYLATRPALPPAPPVAAPNEGAVRAALERLVRWVRDVHGADSFVLPPSAPSATQGGERLEEVRLLRDEMFNSAWGIEHTIENGLGQAWSGHERAQEIAPLHAPLVNDTDAPLEYFVQTDVPLNWIPLLPVAEPDGRAIQFQRAAMLRPNESGVLKRVEPVGRILRPERLETPGVYKIREEEVPRTGVRVSRLVRRTRWIDGSTHLWIARAKTGGRGRREQRPAIRPRDSPGPGRTRALTRG
jgi:hypothetical protein